MAEHERVVGALRELFGRHFGWWAGALDLAQGREEEPTTAHLLAVLVCSGGFAQAAQLGAWPVEQLREGAVALLETRQGCQELDKMDLVEERALEALWESPDAAGQLLRERVSTERSVAIDLIGQSAAVLWHRFRQGAFRPRLVELGKLAADPWAFHEGDVRALLSFLHAHVPDFGRPGRGGEPPGWRTSLEGMMAALPSLQGLRDWAGTLPSPWKEGLLAGIAQVEERRTDPDTRVELARYR